MAKPWWGPFVIQSSLAFVARFAFRLTLAGGTRRRNLKLRAATLEPACSQASSSVTTLASSFRPRGRNDSDRKARPTTGLPCARALASGCARQRCEAMHHCPAPSEFPWLGASSALFARRVCPVRQQLPQGFHILSMPIYASLRRWNAASPRRCRLAGPVCGCGWPDWGFAESNCELAWLHCGRAGPECAFAVPGYELAGPECELSGAVCELARPDCELAGPFCELAEPDVAASIHFSPRGMWGTS